MNSTTRLSIPLLSVLTLTACTSLNAATATESVSTRDARDSSVGSVPNDIVAVIGSQKLTEADLVNLDKPAFDQQQEDFARQRRQMQLRHEEARHQLVQQHLEKLLDQRALELEAKARGITTDAVLKDINVPAVTETETRAFYDARKSQTTMTFEQLQPQISQFLASQHNTDATRSFFDGLRSKHGITSYLSPYRVVVDAIGPTRGKRDAPIIIIEFGDFQCPYCRQEEDVLHSLLAKYPDDVRLVFRQMPLTNIHPNARLAAEAAVCADHQGKFWEMHDAMFQDQEALGEAALKDTAKRLGLDLSAFSSCLSDPKTTATIAADTDAGNMVNVTGTPYFFVNGRPVDGSVPQEQFESLITDELRHLTNGRKLTAGAG